MTLGASGLKNASQAMSWRADSMIAFRWVEHGSAPRWRLVEILAAEAGVVEVIEAFRVLKT
jgi:hypothetical protein